MCSLKGIYCRYLFTTHNRGTAQSSPVYCASNRRIVCQWLLSII
nr:MAG TPA: hypothetical protein [Caudoviricetes sp.]